MNRSRVSAFVAIALLPVLAILAHPAAGKPVTPRPGTQSRISLGVRGLFKPRTVLHVEGRAYLVDRGGRQLAGPYDTIERGPAGATFLVGTTRGRGVTVLRTNGSHVSENTYLFLERGEVYSGKADASGKPRTQEALIGVRRQPFALHPRTGRQTEKIAIPDPQRDARAKAVLDQRARSRF